MTKPLRVVHVVRKMDIGGVQLMLMNYYRNIDRELLQFDFIVQGSEEGFFDKEIIELGGMIYNVTPMHQSLIKYNKEIKKLFLKHNYKIVHIHHNFANIHAATQAYRTKTQCIISHSHSSYVENSIIKRVIKKIIQFRLNNICDYKLACSIEAGEWLYGKRQINKSSTIVINNGIMVQDFRYNVLTRESMRKELNITNEFIIGHVGSFSVVKNHEMLIDIFEYVYKQKQNSRLVLVGDGELKDKIKSKVEKIGLEDKVTFLGNRSDVNNLMQAFDILLFPSTFEGLSLVLVEGQASGLRCIASTNMSNEVDITGLVNFFSLEKPLEYWADQVLKYSDGYKREDTSLQISDSGYDIIKQARRLEELYFNSVKQ